MRQANPYYYSANYPGQDCGKCLDLYIPSQDILNNTICTLGNCSTVRHCSSLSLLGGFADIERGCKCNCEGVNCRGGFPLYINSLFDGCACDCSALDCASEIGGFVEWGKGACSCNCDYVDCHLGRLLPSLPLQEIDRCLCDCSGVLCDPGRLSQKGDCSCDCSQVDCGIGQVLQSKHACSHSITQ